MSLRLRLRFLRGREIPIEFLHLIPTYKLTALELEGIVNWSLQPNSMQFPVLTVPHLKIDRTIQFLDAIIATNLEHCDATLEDHLPILMFSGLGSKFSSIQRLSIYSRTGSFADEKDHVAHTYCEAFPGVRHVELDSDALSRICPTFPLSADPTQSSLLYGFLERLGNLISISARVCI